MFKSYSYFQEPSMQQNIKPSVGHFSAWVPGQLHKLHTHEVVPA